MDFQTYLTEVLRLNEVKEVEIVNIEPVLPLSFEKEESER